MARATVRQWRVKTPAATFHLHYPEIFSKYSLHSTQPPGQSTLAWERGGDVERKYSISIISQVQAILTPMKQIESLHVTYLKQCSVS